MANIFGGGGGSAGPSLGNVDISGGEAASEGAMANRYAQLGIPQMAGPDIAALGQEFGTQQAALNNQVLQSQFQNQVQQNQLSNTNLSNLASAAGFLGIG